MGNTTSLRGLKMDTFGEIRLRTQDGCIGVSKKNTKRMKYHVVR